MCELKSVVQVGVGVIVYDERGRVLIGKRKGSHGAGEYSLPGGKPHAGESPVRCALREVAEEAAIAVKNAVMLPFCTYDSFPEYDRHFVTTFVKCEWLTGVPRNMEPEKLDGSWAWYPWEDIPEPIFGGVVRLREWIAEQRHLFINGEGGMGV